MTQLALGDLSPPTIWSHIPIEDPRGREIADRHYSRQTPGARGYVGPGERFAFLHDGDDGKRALWAVCRAMDPVGNMQWRNTIFRKHDVGTSNSELSDMYQSVSQRACAGVTSWWGCTTGDLASYRTSRE